MTETETGNTEFQQKETSAEKAMTEISYENNFGYILEDETCFRSTDYKILQSRAGDIFIRCMKLLYNGKTEIFYLTENYCPVSEMLKNMTEDTLLKVIAGLLDDIIEVENNGFLSGENVELSWDRIYVDTGTLKVRLVYVPVTFKLNGSHAEFAERLRSGLIRLLSGTDIPSDGRIKSLIPDLSDSSLSLKELRRRIGGAEQKEDKTQYKPGVWDGNPPQNGILRLVAVNAPYHFEIPLNSSSAVIGKKAGAADVTVPFGRLISRKHCVIIKRNEEYFITDMGSTNGTYVNQNRLVSGREYRIGRGDIVRLADIDFRVV